MMKICPKCGTANGESARFCEECGTFLAVPAAGAPDPEPAPSAPEPEPAPASSAPEPEPAPSAPDPGPAPSAPDPEPASAAPDPEPAPSAPEPEPAPFSPGPEPASFSPDFIPSSLKPLSFGTFLGFGLLFLIPCAGVVIQILAALGAFSDNENLKNYARATLVIEAIMLVLGIISLTGMIAGFADLFR